MKRLAFAVISIAILFPMSVKAQDHATVSHDGVTLSACGLFGPSRRELMEQMICQQNQHLAVSRDGNATLHRIEVEQARQTELLRQIAGQTARAADNTQRAADAGQGLQQYLLTKPLRDYPALPSDAPSNIRGLPDVTPTLPNLRGSQSLPSDSPGNVRGTPDVNVGPILQGTSGRTYYAKSTRVVDHPPSLRK
jgi:hypothetical protein